MINHNRSHTTIRPLNPPDVPVAQKRRELAGERLPEEQAAPLDRSNIDALSAVTPTALDEGELEAGAEGGRLSEAEFPDIEELETLAERYQGELPSSIEAMLPEIERLELLADIYERMLPLGVEEGFAADAERLDLLTSLELRAEETGDPLIASDEGSTYIPPIDPPIVPGRAGTLRNAEIASGLGISALDEPYDESHHSSFLTDDDEMSARVREALRADSSTALYADTIDIETRDGMVILRGVVDDLLDNDNLLAVASDVAGVTEVVDALHVRL